MTLPDIVAIGIYDSKIAARNTKISKNRKTTMFELELPIEEGGITYINSDSAHIHPDMFICAKPNQNRHSKFPFKCYYIHMILHEGDLYDVLMNAPDFFETEKKEIYANIFQKLINHYNTFDRGENIMIQSLLLELIYTISRDSQRFVKHNAESGNYSLIEDTLAYIERNLTEELTLEKVSARVSLSPIYFHHVFKASVGKTLRDYIEEQRIKKATHLLLTTNLSLTEIAFECGFSSQSYFSYVFKRRMKQTPREYSKAIYERYEI